MSGPYDQQVLGQTAGRVAGGQYVTQTLTQSQQGSTGRAQRGNRNESSTSSSSSDNYKVSGAGGAGVAGVQGAAYQYSAESNYALGGAAGVAAGGSYAGAADSFGSVVSGQRRQGRYQKQVIRLPDQPQGPVRQVRRRLPTPEPDTLERVYIQRAANEIVEEITEVPTTPPPRVQERTVVEPAGPPQVIKKVIRVPPRGGGYQLQSQQGVSFASNVGQASNLLSAGSYGNVQQASGGYQQYGGVPSAGYGGYGAVGGGYGAVGGGGYGAVGGGGYGAVGGGGYGAVGGGGYGAVGGGYQQQGYGYGGFPSQASAGYGGVSQATCFYV